MDHGCARGGQEGRYLSVRVCDPKQDAHGRSQDVVFVCKMVLLVVDRATCGRSNCAIVHP